MEHGVSPSPIRRDQMPGSYPAVPAATTSDHLRATPRAGQEGQRDQRGGAQGQPSGLSAKYGEVIAAVALKAHSLMVFGLKLVVACRNRIRTHIFDPHEAEATETGGSIGSCWMRCCVT